MSAIQRLLERLQRHPEVAYRVAAGMVTVDPPTPDGFPVSLIETAGKWVVSFDKWHEHFESEDEALNCFAFGLSDRCRLRVHYRGHCPYRWAVEERRDGDWRQVSTTGLLFFPFWRKPQIKYYQNVIISTAEPSAAAGSGA